MVRILGVVLVALFVVGIGSGSAQVKPAEEKDRTGEKAQTEKTTAAADPVSGTWDGTVETQNGTISFGLTLKLDKDKVTGDIASHAGSTPLNGTWTDSRLSVTFDYNGSPVTMTGGIKDDSFSGEMSFGGQAVMPWTAKLHK